MGLSIPWDFGFRQSGLESCSPGRFAYWFSAGTYTGEIETYLDGSPVERAVLGSLIFAGLFVLLRRRANWSAIFGESAAVWIFYAFALLSVAWSPYPPVTLKRIIRELGTIVMILVVLTETNQLDAVKRVFVRCALVLVPLSMLFIKYYPAIGRNYHRWTHQVQYNGVTTNKNSLGVLAMLGGLFLLWHIAEQKKGVTRWQQFVSVWPEACVFGLCVWILYIANSATALACFLLGVVLFLTGRTVLRRSQRQSHGRSYRPRRPRRIDGSSDVGSPGIRCR